MPRRGRTNFGIAQPQLYQTAQRHNQQNACGDGRHIPTGHIQMADTSPECGLSRIICARHARHYTIMPDFSLDVSLFVADFDKTEHKTPLHIKTVCYLD